MKQPAFKSVRCCTGIAITLLIFLIAAPVSGGDSLTKGNQFTVTVIGTPGTAYYVWLHGTSSMTGLPGDQPPIVAGGQANIVQDPSDGPYTIGNYQWYGGGGYTILDDVAPSTASVPNTSYYAQVTTDDNGYGTVAFQTSSNTAARTFSVKAQNPASPGKSVSVVAGVPTTIPTTVATTKRTLVVSTTVIQTTDTTVPPTATPEITPNDTTTVPTTRKSPAAGGIAVAALAILIGIFRRN